MIDEIDKMIDRMQDDNAIVHAIRIMYPKQELDLNNPVQILFLFVSGLKVNEFFEYIEFIRRIKNGK